MKALPIVIASLMGTLIGVETWQLWRRSLHWSAQLVFQD